MKKIISFLLSGLLVASTAQASILLLPVGGAALGALAGVAAYFKKSNGFQHYQAQALAKYVLFGAASGATCGLFGYGLTGWKQKNTVAPSPAEQPLTVPAQQQTAAESGQRVTPQTEHPASELKCALKQTYHYCLCIDELSFEKHVFFTNKDSETHSTVAYSPSDDVLITTIGTSVIKKNLRTNATEEFSINNADHVAGIIFCGNEAKYMLTPGKYSASRSGENALRISPDGNKVELFKADNPEDLKEVSSRGNTINSVSFSPDGMQFLVALHGTIEIYDTQTCAGIKSLTNSDLRFDYSNPIKLGTWSPCGKYIAVVGAGCGITVVDAQTWQIVHTYQIPECSDYFLFSTNVSLCRFSRLYGYKAASYSPDSRFIATLKSGIISFTDLNSNATHTFEFANALTNGTIAWAPDSNSLAFASNELVGTIDLKKYLQDLDEEYKSLTFEQTNALDRAQRHIAAQSLEAAVTELDDALRSLPGLGLMSESVKYNLEKLRITLN